MEENQFIQDDKVFDNSGLIITTNIGQPTSQSRELRFSEFFTIETIGVQPTDNVVPIYENVGLSLDKKNIKNFFKYGNSAFFVQKLLEKLILQYPAALHSTPVFKNLDRVGDNIINISYDAFNDVSTLYFPTNHISNPLGVYYSVGEVPVEVNPIRDMVSNWYEYVLDIDGTEYPLISFTPAQTDQNSIISIKINGRPITTSVFRQSVYIRPSQSAYDTYKNTLSEIERYFTEQPFRFYASKISENNVRLEYVIRFSIPMADNFNLDFYTSKYENFYTDITTFFQDYDELQGNILLKYIPESVKSLTLEGNGDDIAVGRLNQMMLLWGNEFDVLHRKAKNLTLLNTLGGFPDEYVQLFIKNMGLCAYSNSISTSEWKVLLMNLVHIWKSKGTRASVLFLLDFFNVPQELVEFNEHKYVSSGNINIDYLTEVYAQIDKNLTLANLPVTSEGGMDISKLSSPPTLSSAVDEMSNLIPALNNYQIERTVERDYQGNIYSLDFNVSGHTFDYVLYDKNFEGTPCFGTSGGTVNDLYPTGILDECGCALPLVDKVFKINNTALDIYADGCVPIVLDVMPILHTSSVTFYTTSETVTTITGCTETECPIIDYVFQVEAISSTYNGTYTDSATFHVTLDIVSALDVTFTDIQLIPSAGFPNPIRRINDTDFMFTLNYSSSASATNFICDFFITTECGCRYEVSLPGNPLSLNHNAPPQTDSDSGSLSSITPIITGGTVTEIMVESGETLTCYNTLEFNIYGGASPYTIVGADTETVFLSGETYSVYATDANGCVSNLVTGCTICGDPECYDIQIFGSYECISGTTTATLGYTVSGATEPYEVTGGNIGDVIGHGEIISLTVTDANGCTHTDVFEVDCNPESIDCDPILYDTALETTAVNMLEKTATVTLTYLISGLPPSVYVDEVDITAFGIGVSDNYLIGSPISQNFDTISGAKQYFLEFEPDVNGTVTLQFELTVLLTDGCIYNKRYDLTVNAATIGSTEEKSLILTT